jgi:hypothetical protein
VEQKNFSELSDDELRLEADKLKKSKLFHALAIGVLAGILLFGLVSWFMNAERRIGFLIPMAIPVVFIYRILKKSKNNQELEKVLKERGLN